jgi:hypothetical protein
MELFFEGDLEVEMNELFLSHLQRHIDRGEKELRSRVAWA